MVKISNFLNHYSFNGQSETLLSWVNSHRDIERIRSLFLNLDCALKYVHDHGYCVSNFSPTEIYVLSDREDCIQFKQLVEMPQNLEQREKFIQEDIFKSSFLQISIYCDSITNLTPQFLMEHFNDITLFLPPQDVPYYRGIIERGASVYLYEYRLEDFRRNLRSLDTKDVSSNSIGRIVQKNEYINGIIYQQINNSNAAFVHYLIIPTIIFGFLFLFSIICWCISIFF